MIMEDYIPIPTTCLFSSSSNRDHHPTAEAAPRPGQTVISSTYRTKISGICHAITVTWRRSALLRSLTVSIGRGDNENNNTCKVDLKPWSFRKRHGSKRFVVGPTGPVAALWWDLREVKFHGDTEPITGYYVAVVSGEEIVLFLGDMRDEAYKRAEARPAPIEPSLVSKRDHVYGKRRFSTRAKFHEKDKVHEITIECKNEVSCGSSNKDGSTNNGNNIDCCEPEMEIRLDGNVLVKVKHLQWKFRGNELVHVDKLRVEVFWDVHDWLFSPGLRHALFIFKPVGNYSPAIMSSSSLSSSSTSSPPPEYSSASTPLSSSGSFEGSRSAGSSEFCLFLYAWKAE